jgi:hypothetical protein
MNEALIAVFVIAIVILIVAAIYVAERWGGCWHKWNNWFDESTDAAYVQWRCCAKCGYIEREQWLKKKEKS